MSFIRVNNGFFVLMVAFCLFPVSVYANSTINAVCFDSACIRPEIADIDYERAKGLMFRDDMGEDQGMLFVFENEARRAFWMKNMKFALDIIWIDADGTIVDISENASPCKEACENIVSRRDAMYVLEVKSGFTGRKNIRIGDEVSFK